VKCTYCHYQNHIYEDCRTRKRHEQEASTSQKQEQNNSVAHLASKQKEVSDSEMFNLEHAFVSFRLGKLQADDWFADSASTEHMTEHRHYFTSFEPISHKWNMKGVGRDNQPLEVKGKGDIKIKITVGTNVHYQILQDVPSRPHLLATAQQIEDFCLPTNVKSEISFTLGLMFEGEMKKFIYY
jgi:hypothetical protein